ncbi:nucleoside-diphosphate sugar epimerase/dehydratase [Botrimarina sp.]|uniref:polysaccharide biosynthesis protein n=1 Tax=Botrimarina sp. TaxID=2795802 RepID=UPI0032F00D2C
MSRVLRRAAVLIAFATVAAGAFLGAYLLRFGGPPAAVHREAMWALAACAVAIKLVVFSWRRLDRGLSRPIGFHDLLAIAAATTWSTLGLTFADAVLLPGVNAPRGVLLIDWGTTLLAFGLLRAAPRAVRDWRRRLRREQGRRVLIVGANDEGEALLRSLSLDRRHAYRAVGFVDPDPSHRGQRIGGVSVVGAPEEIPWLAASLGVEEVLVTGSLPGRVVRRVMADAEPIGVPVRVLPTHAQLLGGTVSVGPRDVSIEDLLRRDPVRIDGAAIAHQIAGKTVLVTGSSGSIGSEICRQLLKHGPARLVALDRAETAQFFLEQELQRVGGDSVEVVLGDTTDPARIDAVFAEHQPDVVFHAAAYKHVPLMERHPGEAVKNIVAATANVADAAERHGAESFVMVSTDKAVRPTSVMGACKQLAERYVQAKSVGSACRYVTVRFGNVLDSAGSVIPIFRQQILAGGPVTVTHPEINRYFMMIPEAAQLVIQAGAMGRGGEVFVLDMGEPVRILDLARDMIRLSGLVEGEDIEIRITGLRPGEKLYEELYHESERHKPTAHEKILAADAQPEPLVTVLNSINRLSLAVDRSDGDVLAELDVIVPRFDSGLMSRAA